jgi:phosphatidylserine decarboxylase
MGDAPRPRVGIFLSVLNVHVQRAPISGTVRRVVHTSGQFLPADHPKADDANEQVALCIATPSGQKVGVIQIAGLIARRILCEVDEADHLQRGQTYGLIRFGSRVDTYLPQGTKAQVKIGQTMVGGETVIGHLP